MDGFDLARQIVGRADLAGATIMMLTSSGRYDDVTQCREIGITSCLTKPIASVDLHEAICAALDSASSRQATAASAAARTAPAPAARPRTVLLAEDNIVNQRVAVGLLSRRGHRVTVAANGQEAVDVLERERFDIVLMDLQMPVMGGLEATEVIRERERRLALERVRIVAMTAHAMTGDRERCLAAGMDGYLAKPTEPHALFAEVEGTDGAALPAPLIDQGDLVRRLHGDKELAADIVRLFTEECPALLDGIRKALDRGDAPGVRRAAHTLKGAAATAAATGISESAAVLEVLAAEGDIDALESAWKTVSAAATALLESRANRELSLKETR